MAYDIDISDADREYLAGLTLSAQARERIERHVENGIANVSDEFRLDPKNRVVGE